MLGSTRCDNRTSARDQNRDGSHAHPHGGRAGRSEGISARLSRGGSILGCRGGGLHRINTRGDVNASGHRSLIVGGSVRLRCSRGGITVRGDGRRGRRVAATVGGSGRHGRRVTATVRRSGRRDRRVAITIGRGRRRGRRNGRSRRLAGLLTHRGVTAAVHGNGCLIRRGLLIRRRTCPIAHRGVVPVLLDRQRRATRQGIAVLGGVR